MITNPNQLPSEKQVQEQRLYERFWATWNQNLQSCLKKDKPYEVKFKFPCTEDEFRKIDECIVDLRTSQGIAAHTDRVENVPLPSSSPFKETDGFGPGAEITVRIPAANDR